MTAQSLLPWRRVTTPDGLWNLFAWFGRACDQSAGMLLNPLVVAVFARSVQPDPFRISWLVAGFGIGWLLGTAIAPVLQQVTIRVMPWIVGGFIVRTAAIVLIAFAATDHSSSNNQRFKSILICYVAYGIATGIARTAQARHVIRQSPGGILRPGTFSASVGLALVFGLAALATWSALSSTELGWDQSFGRVWSLAAVALGVATIAAIREGADNPELPDPRRIETSTTRQPTLSVVNAPLMLTVAGLAALAFLEVLALIFLFGEFRRQTIFVRGALGFFAAGWVVGLLAWAALRGRYAPVLLAQLSIGFATAGIVLAVATPDLIRSSWFPETVRGHTSLSVLVYVVGLAVGIGIAGRRMALAAMFESRMMRNQRHALLASAIACGAPLLVGWTTTRYALSWVLIGGIVVALVVLASAGMMAGHSPARLPGHSVGSPARHALLPRQ